MNYCNAMYWILYKLWILYPASFMWNSMISVGKSPWILSHEATFSRIYSSLHSACREPPTTIMDMVPTDYMIICINLMRSPFIFNFFERMMWSKKYSGFQGMLGRIIIYAGHGRCCIYTAGITGSYHLSLPLDGFWDLWIWIGHLLLQLIS